LPSRNRVLLTVREVAAFLRVSARTVYALCEQGRVRRAFHVKLAMDHRESATDLT